MIKRTLKTTGQKGFTLVEVLMTLALTSVMLMIITDVFVTLVEVQTESEAASSVTQDGRYILNKLQHDIQHASSVTTPVNPGDSGQSLGLVIGTETVTYQLSTNDNLVRYTDAAPPDLDTYRLNGSGTQVSNLSFQKLQSPGDTPTIRANFTTTSLLIETSGDTTQDYTITVGLR